jgi:hypothetical protein
VLTLRSINQMYGVSGPSTVVSVPQSVVPASAHHSSSVEQHAVIPRRVSVENTDNAAQRLEPAPKEPPPSLSSNNELSLPSVSPRENAVSNNPPSHLTSNNVQHTRFHASLSVESGVPRAPTQTQSFPVQSDAPRALRQCGVGVYLKLAEEGFIEVKATEPGCSADNLLFPGDIVTSVDSTSCVGMSIRDITRLIVGEEGSCVTITVIRSSPISPTSFKTFMKETPVVLIRRPLPEQRSSRAIRALSEHSVSRTQTPRGDQHVQDNLQQQPPIAQLRRSNSAPDHLPPLTNADQLSALPPSQDVKADGVMRQFLLHNTGPLPIKLTIFDCDDVMRVSEMVAPSSQYPFEQHTCVPQFSAAMLACLRVLSCRYLPLPSKQRVRVVLKSGLSEFYLQVNPARACLRVVSCDLRSWALTKGLSFVS